MVGGIVNDWKPKKTSSPSHFAADPGDRAQRWQFHLAARLAVPIEQP